MSKKENNVNATNRDRSYWHHAVLYPDNPSHCTFMEVLKLMGWSYASILHDKDCNSDGELKKPHWHIVLRFDSARSPAGVAREWGIEKRFIHSSDFKDKTLLYLTHDDSASKKAMKYRYSVDAVEGPLADLLRSKLAEQNGIGMDEGSAISYMMDFISSYDGYLSITRFSHYVISVGFWSFYRRNAYIINSIISEHNNGVRLSPPDPVISSSGVVSVGGKYEEFRHDFAYLKGRLQLAREYGINEDFYHKHCSKNFTQIYEDYQLLISNPVQIVEE